MELLDIPTIETENMNKKKRCRLRKLSAMDKHMQLLRFGECELRKVIKTPEDTISIFVYKYYGSRWWVCIDSDSTEVKEL